MAKFSVTLGSSETQIAPWADCSRVNYRCPNKECIEAAYVCDGVNDCGCNTDGCDEHQCGGLNWSEYTTPSISTPFNHHKKYHLLRNWRNQSWISRCGHPASHLRNKAFLIILKLVKWFQVHWSLHFCVPGPAMKVLFGIGVGFLGFTVLFLGIGFGEMYIKMKAEEEDKKVEGRKKSKISKRSSSGLRQQGSCEGVRISVPNGTDETLTPLTLPTSSPVKTKPSFASYFKF